MVFSRKTKGESIEVSDFRYKNLRLVDNLVKILCNLQENLNWKESNHGKFDMNLKLRIYFHIYVKLLSIDLFEVILPGPKPRKLIEVIFVRLS